MLEICCGSGHSLVYNAGRGAKELEKNKDEALTWLRRSANAGYDAAYDMLSGLEDE